MLYIRPDHIDDAPVAPKVPAPDVPAPDAPAPEEQAPEAPSQAEEAKNSLYSGYPRRLVWAC